MAPFIKEHIDPEKLKQDILHLSRKGIDKEDIHLLFHDSTQTGQIVNEFDDNTAGINEMDLKNLAGNCLKTGDGLGKALNEMGISEQQAAHYEERLKEGVCLLVIQNTQAQNPDGLLGNI